MAHVRAARALVPRWLEDGQGGRFVVTASAAGLLTMIGSAPYSVTKHAAVGFAEWLSVTYGARGIDVHAICPQGVRTQMLEDAGPLQALLSRDSALRARAGRRRGRRRDRRGPVPGAPPPRGGRLLRRPRDRHRPLAGRHAPAAAEGRRGRRARMSDGRPPDWTSTAFRTWYDAQRPGEIAGEPERRGDRRRQVQPHLRGHRRRRRWWIVRRPPLGHVQATAHDMGREYTAMSALADTTDVPVPTTYAHCADPDVLGAPFYVMERIDGTAYRSAQPARAARPGAHRRDRRPDGRRAGRAARGRPGRGRARRVRPAGRASWSARCAGGASSSRARRPPSARTPTSCTAG